ncbi:MAG: hypothetical protein QW767_04665 [Thermoprotei archaeon]
MVSERAVGGLILTAFVIILVVYSAVLWVPGVDRYALFAVKLITWIIVVGVSGIAIWLGWVMVTTKPIVPDEKSFESSTEQKPSTEQKENQEGSKPAESQGGAQKQDSAAKH